MASAQRGVTRAACRPGPVVALSHADPAIPLCRMDVFVVLTLGLRITIVMLRISTCIMGDGLTNSLVNQATRRKLMEPFPAHQNMSFCVVFWILNFSFLKYLLNVWTICVRKSK